MYDITIQGQIVQEWHNGVLVREHIFPEAKTMKELRKCARELKAELKGKFLIDAHIDRDNNV